MKVEQVKISALDQDPTNARRHGTRNLAAIKASLQRFGQQKPIVIGPDNVVVAGNGMLEAACALGWEKIKVVRTRLAGLDRTAYAIADNRTAELAEWEYEPLAQHLAALKDEGVDLADLGWAEHEWEPLLAADWKPPAVEELPTPTDGQGKPIMVTAEQRKTVDAAIAKVRKSAKDEQLSEGRCVELICAEYLEGKWQPYI